MHTLPELEEKKAEASASFLTWKEPVGFTLFGCSNVFGNTQKPRNPSKQQQFWRVQMKCKYWAEALLHVLPPQRCRSRLEDRSPPRSAARGPVPCSEKQNVVFTLSLHRAAWGEVVCMAAQRRRAPMPCSQVRRGGVSREDALSLCMVLQFLLLHYQIFAHWWVFRRWKKRFHFWPGIFSPGDVWQRRRVLGFLMLVFEGGQCEGCGFCFLFLFIPLHLLCRVLSLAAVPHC